MNLGLSYEIRKGFPEARGAVHFFWNQVAHPDPRLLYGNQEQLPETGKTVLIYFFVIWFVYPDPYNCKETRSDYQMPGNDLYYYVSGLLPLK